MLLVGLLGIVSGINYFLVHRPVSKALEADPRNAGYALAAHYRYYIDKSTLVLDLRNVTAAAPIDLFRGLFQSAAALSTARRSFERVVLSRGGAAVFVLEGKDFHQLGVEFSNGQNPVYLIRTLPQKLFDPSGAAAFATWEGGLIGVVGKQMEDVNEAARRWARSE